MIKEGVLNSLQGGNTLVTGCTGLIDRQIVKILGNTGTNLVIVSLNHIQISGKIEHI